MLCDEYLMGVRFENLEKEENRTQIKRIKERKEEHMEVVVEEVEVEEDIE